MADVNMETKESSNSAEEYLWGVIYYADWIKPAYKKFADAYRTNSKALRELYLCFCDKVPESALKKAAKSDCVELAFKLCRKEYMEKEWLGEYSQKPEKLRTVSNETENEVKQMPGRESNIAEAMPDWDVMFSKEIPEVLPDQTVTTDTAPRLGKSLKKQISTEAADEAPAQPLTAKIKNEADEKKTMERVVPQKKGKGKFFRLLKKKISELFCYKNNPSRFVIELYSQGYADAQINFILDCMERGMTFKEIDKIADPKIPVDMMKKMCDMHMKKKGDKGNGIR